MHSKDIATRRFYGAFFAWAQITRTPRSRPFHHCTRCNAQTESFAAFDGPERERSTFKSSSPDLRIRQGPRLAKQTTSRVRERSVLERERLNSVSLNSQTPIYTSETVEQASTPFSIDRPPANVVTSEVSFTNGNYDPALPALSIGGLLAQSQVQSEDQLPFESILYCGWTVRSRIEEKYTVEYAIPQGILDYLTHTWRMPLEECARRHSINIDVQESARIVKTSEDSGLAGTKLLRVILSGATGRMNQPGLVDLMADMQTAIGYYLLPIKSNNDDPSTERDCLQVRQRSVDNLTLDLLASEGSSWAESRIRQMLHPEVHLSVGNPESSAQGPARCIRLTGPSGAVIKDQQNIDHIVRSLQLRESESFDAFRGATVTDTDSKDILQNQTSNQNSKTGEIVRTAVRQLTYPAVVVTSSHLTRNASESHDTYSSCRGVTVSSFTTVCLHPKVMISFNLKVPSRSWDAMKASGWLRIHLLNASTSGAGIADTFTRPYDLPSEPFRDLARTGSNIRTFSYPAPPLIDRPDTVQAHMSARIISDKCVSVGDHIIVVAEVFDCQLPHEHASPALAYAVKAYRSQGQSIGMPAGSSPSGRNKSVTESNANQSRSFSTVSRRFRPNISDLVEPSARNTTVGEFLGVPDHDWIGWSFPHTTNLIEANDAAQSAAQLLSDGAKSGVPLTYKEVQELEKIMDTSQKKVDRSLSQSAARSLRLMLNRGRVDFKRAQWLEYSIERGQVALTSDLERLDSAFNEGVIEESKYQSAKKRLEGRRDILVTELMRLRQYVDEDGDNPEEFEDYD